jgi:hypothetical protein
MRARVIFIGKHRCRLGGDCANLFGLLEPTITGWPRTDLRKHRPLEKSWRRCPIVKLALSFCPPRISDLNGESAQLLAAGGASPNSVSVTA